MKRTTCVPALAFAVSALAQHPQRTPRRIQLPRRSLRARNPAEEYRPIRKRHQRSVCPQLKLSSRFGKSLIVNQPWRTPT
jgi:hypothetical protein